MTDFRLLRGDCLDRLRELPKGSIDMVLCDLPYGTTACAWDQVIPFEPLWAEYRRIVAGSGAIVLTASQPFTSALVMSNPSWFKYAWVWEKSRVGGFWDCKYRPLKAHEDVLVFSRGGCSNGSRDPVPYFPQGLSAGKGSWTAKPVSGNSRSGSSLTGVRDASNYPRSVQRIASEVKTVHPTQKPVALFEYLIRTYTVEGATVLDNAMGSGTTGVACATLGRRFVGIEKDPTYFDLARRRIEAVVGYSLRDNTDII